MNSYSKARLEAMSRANAASAWLAQGYSPMPVIAGSKSTRYKFAQWFNGQSEGTVDVHWSIYTEDEIALHCGKGLVVLDADSTESLEAMLALEAKHGLEPKMVVNTKKGVHHYFRQSPELRIKAAGHNTENHPERIDVRCGNGYIIAPPSTEKSLLTPYIVPFEDLSFLTQAFVDELCIHNGDRVRAERPERLVMQDTNEFGGPLDMSAKVARMRAMLEHINPEEGYSDWISVLMAIHHETDGSDEGLALADEWSSKGERYKGTCDVEKKWASFDAGSSTPVTMATLASKLKNQGLDWMGICAEADDPFEVCETEVVSMPAVKSSKASTQAMSLKQFTLLGNLDAVRKYAVEASPLLGNLALKGQFTVFYANSNVGKTLITLHLLSQAIGKGTIEADKVFYANVDDGSDGILIKGEIAETYGFHELAVGYQGFSRDAFFESVKAMIKSREASGTLLILDTIKKFTDVTSKVESSEFAELMRKYTAVGGTVLALAHTNKNRNVAGKVVQGGTSDIPQDADCTYTIDAKDEGGERHVTFENTKARGPVARMARYAYSLQEKDYKKLLSTVREITVDELAHGFEVVPDENPDERMIRAFKEVIGSGFTGKTELIDRVKRNTQFSKAKVEQVHDRYCGASPEKHHWDFTLGGKGTHRYHLIHDELEAVDLA